MRIKVFVSRYKAKQAALRLVGWSYKIKSGIDGYVIECHGYRYLLEDGRVG
jgi:outer membrane phospholipase A